MGDQGAHTGWQHGGTTGWQHGPPGDSSSSLESRFGQRRPFMSGHDYIYNPSSNASWFAGRKVDGTLSSGR